MAVSRTSTADHAAHDALLLAALASGDVLEPADHTRADDLVRDCPECALLLADMTAIRAATADLPAPPRRRDFRLTDADAARLRPSGWRRILAGFGSPQARLTGPAALGLATLGVAGLLFATIPSAPLPGATTMNAPGAGAAADTYAGSVAASPAAPMELALPAASDGAAGAGTERTRLPRRPTRRRRPSSRPRPASPGRPLPRLRPSRRPKARAHPTRALAAPRSRGPSRRPRRSRQEAPPRSHRRPRTSRAAGERAPPGSPPARCSCSLRGSSSAGFGWRGSGRPLSLGALRSRGDRLGRIRRPGSGTSRAARGRSPATPRRRRWTPSRTTLRRPVLPSRGGSSGRARRQSPERPGTGTRRRTPPRSRRRRPSCRPWRSGPGPGSPKCPIPPRAPRTRHVATASRRARHGR